MKPQLRIGFGMLLATAAMVAAATPARACPFCSAVAQTLSEEIDGSQVVVIAKLMKLPPAMPANGAAQWYDKAPLAEFSVLKVLKGDEAIAQGRTVETVFFGDAKVGSTFLILGIEPPEISWGTPIAISERGQDYLLKAMELPKEGADRLAFFQDYLEDADESLSRDAYDEFARMPYSSVRELKGRMKHDQLVSWVKNKEIPASRRRLYLTMLGICGTPEDVPMLEEMIRSKDRPTRGALDALVASYLSLKGAEGMPLVEELFLKNKDAEYTDTYATIIAMRVLGEEQIVPRARLLEGLKLMLDRPQLADLVIPDLARWEDWSAVDRLVSLFKNADEESNWVRVPVIIYLRTCPLPEAKKYIEELAKLDPDTVKRAEAFFPFSAPAAADEKKSTSEPGTQQGSTRQDSTSEVAPAPGAAPSEAPVFGGLAVAAIVFGCAVWTIARGGRQQAE